ncbi:MAG: hypothetical protein LBR73_04125 [Oscillospiraceae bacterium]|jgi:hypothetical protein|nr:hypothetical protein [Oscillospiraceae bacterium]
MTAVNVRDYGAVGDGKADDSPAVQAALDAGASVVSVPEGIYRLVAGLKIGSDTVLQCGDGVHFVFDGDTPRTAADFMLSNKDMAGGNRNITIIGGSWDRQNTAPGTQRSKDLFDTESYSGNTMRFVNVQGLRIEDVGILNAQSHGIAFSDVDGFSIRRISFSSRQETPNQDGIHFGGNVKNGLVEFISASGKQTNDDLIALNADDCNWRNENNGLSCGDIENVVIQHIHAEDCWSFIRMATCKHSAIRNISIRDVTGGCRRYAVNMDALRYCRTPLFREEDEPDGVGWIENVELRDMVVHKTDSANTEPLVVGESRLHEFRMKNFLRNRLDDCSPTAPLAVFKNLSNTCIVYDDLDDRHAVRLQTKQDQLLIPGYFMDLRAVRLRVRIKEN